jgi:hypothetical protein
VEELDGFCDAIFDAPTAGVVADEGLDRGVEVVGDQERGLLVAVAANDDLAEVALVAAQADAGVVYLGVGELSLLVRDVDAPPGLHALDVGEKPLAAAAERDKPHALGVDLG